MSILPKSIHRLRYPHCWVSYQTMWTLRTTHSPPCWIAVHRMAPWILTLDGSFNYTPAVGFEGLDTFTYHANDGLADSNLATVNITVTPINNAPLAVDDIYSTQEDLPLVVSGPGVLLNDSDPENRPTHRRAK